jgi:hypothetical protein
MNFILYFSYNLPIYMLAANLAGLMYFLLKNKKINPTQEYTLIKKYKLYLIINLVFSLIIFLFNIEYIIDSPIIYSLFLFLVNLCMWLTIQLSNINSNNIGSLKFKYFILIIDNGIRMSLLVLIIFNNQYF